MENHRTKDLHPIPEPNNMPKRLSSVDGESKSKDDFVSAEIEDNTASNVEILIQIVCKCVRKFVETGVNVYIMSWFIFS